MEDAAMLMASLMPFQKKHLCSQQEAEYLAPGIRPLIALFATLLFGYGTVKPVYTVQFFQNAATSIGQQLPHHKTV